MRQKGYFFFFTLFVLSLIFINKLSADRIDQSTIKKLADQRYWQVLLHIKNGKTEIDDSSFFLSNSTEFSAVSELNATINQILDQNESLSCKYPARIAWLQQKLPSLFEKNSFECEKLEKSIQKEHIQTITLVFPAAYINSPASMFGHTFLRLDKDIKIPMLGEAVNYAARTEEENGLIYTYNGLFGGYKGYYSVLPYYKKIKEYSAMEQRDMWEYTLNLDSDEIKRLLYHLYELRGISGDYYFFTKNCSYNLLWLLESAKIDTYLPDQFRYKAIPVDTIRAVKDKKLIDHTRFRPSKRREMQSLIKNIKDIETAKEFSESYDFSILKRLTDSQKAVTLDLGIEVLKYKRSQNKINKKDYISTLMKLLKYRSKLPKKIKLKIQKPMDPLNGHKSARMAFWLGNNQKFSFEIKPAMHDKYDIASGYIPGAYIDFFKLFIERSKFKSFDFVSVTSLSPRDSFFKPLSWKAKISFQQLQNKSDKRFLTLGGGAGFSWKKEEILIYLMGEPTLYLGKSTLASVGLDSGVIFNFNKSTAGIEYKKSFFSDGSKTSRVEIFATWQMVKAFALNLKLYEDKIEQKRDHYIEAGLFYYF